MNCRARQTRIGSVTDLDTLYSPDEQRLPDIAPTGRHVEVPLVVIVQTREGQVVCERIYWDQASVLVQIGLLDARHLPVVGVDSAHKVLWAPALTSNALIQRR